MCHCHVGDTWCPLWFAVLSVFCWYRSFHQCAIAMWVTHGVHSGLLYLVFSVDISPFTSVPLPCGWHMVSTLVSPGECSNWRKRVGQRIFTQPFGTSKKTCMRNNFICLQHFEQCREITENTYYSLVRLKFWNQHAKEFVSIILLTFLFLNLRKGKPMILIRSLFYK